MQHFIELFVLILFLFLVDFAFCRPENLDYELVIETESAIRIHAIPDFENIIVFGKGEPHAHTNHVVVRRRRLFPISV